MDIIIIDVIKVEQNQFTNQYIVTMPMTPIINSYFNKHPMLGEINHFRLLQPSGSFMKAMCHHQTLTRLTKHFTKKLIKHHAQYIIQQR